MRVFAGSFLRTLPGRPWEASEDWSTDIGYSVDAERSEYLMRHRRLYDFSHDVMFLKGDVCCNLQTKSAILERLEGRADYPHCSPFVSIASHEQYSFPFYGNYIPDHFERMETAVRWCTENGYAPAFHHDAFPAEAE